MESLKQALCRIDAALCTTAATAPMEVECQLDARYLSVNLLAGQPLDAPSYLWRGSAKPGGVGPQFLICRPSLFLLFHPLPEIPSR